MKIGARITSERGKAVTKTANTELVITINIENVDIGRVVTRYEGVNPTRIYYYPIGGSGRTLLYEEKTNENLKHDKKCNKCNKKAVVWSAIDGGNVCKEHNTLKTLESNE